MIISQMNRKPGWLRLLPEQHELLRIDHVRVFLTASPQIVVCLGNCRLAIINKNLNFISILDFKLRENGQDGEM